MTLTIGLILLHHWFIQTPEGQAFRKFEYALLQNSLDAAYERSLHSLSRRQASSDDEVRKKAEQEQLTYRRPVIIDISRDGGIPFAPGVAADRNELDRLLREVSQHFPRAIALDIDFSPLKDQTERFNRVLTVADRGYFGEWSRLKNPRSEVIPVRLGVGRRWEENPCRWFPEDASWARGLEWTLFAGIEIPRDQQTYYYYYQRAPRRNAQENTGGPCGDEQIDNLRERRLLMLAPSLDAALKSPATVGEGPSQAIAQASDPTGQNQRASAPLHEALNQRERQTEYESHERDPEIRPESRGRAPWLSMVLGLDPAASADYARYYIDYSPLNDLQDEVIVYRHGTSLSDYAKRIRGNVVFIGDVANATDKFPVPHRNDAMPGVLIHACALMSLQHPLQLMQLPQFRMPRISVPFSSRTLMESRLVDWVIVLDILISSCLVLLSAYLSQALRHRSFWKEVDFHRLEEALYLLTAGVVFLCFHGLVGWTRIIWPDYLWVTLTVLLHPHVSEPISMLIRVLSKHALLIPKELLSKKDTA